MPSRSMLVTYSISSFSSIVSSSCQTWLFNQSGSCINQPKIENQLRIHLRCQDAVLSYAEITKDLFIAHVPEDVDVKSIRLG